jgi:hypothetical protein
MVRRTRDSIATVLQWHMPSTSVAVTQADINNALAQPGAPAAGPCPITLAMEREGLDPSSYTLPPVAVTFRENYRAGNTVAPFSFTASAEDE